MSVDYDFSAVRCVSERCAAIVRSIRVITVANQQWGRGRKAVYRAPIRRHAEGLGGFVPDTWEDPSNMAWLDAVDENSVLVTASFGRMIPSDIIDRFPPRHCLNVHPSLLPQWRGAAPIQRAILNGDTEFGVTVLELSKEVFDKGDILAQEKVPMKPDAGFPAAQDILSRAGGKLLINCLENFERFKANARPMEGKGSYAPKITKEDAELRDISKWPAWKVLNAMKAFEKQHFLLGRINGTPTYFHKLMPLDDPETRREWEQPEYVEPGSISWKRPDWPRPILGCGDGKGVLINQIRPITNKHKAPIGFKMFWNSHVVQKGLAPVAHLDRY